MSTSVPLINDVVSREFFAIAKTDERAIRKINRWKKRKESGEDEVPPTVIIFGVDTLSRLNAHRTLTETLNVLRSIGAIEIDGYTKGSYFSMNGPTQPDRQFQFQVISYINVLL